MTEFKVLDHGIIKLINIMPRDNCDNAIVDAARISYNSLINDQDINIKKNIVNTNEGLIRYLMRHKHWTPFEQVKYQFVIKCPMFVARQWLRHRTANVNEYSLRYSEAIDEFYVPDKLRKQSTTNNQGSSDEPLSDDDNNLLIEKIKHNNQCCMELYREMLEYGIAKEMARTVLPAGLYTQFYWCMDLRNLLNFIGLRSDNHAQYEIRVYADIIAEIVKQYNPIAFKAYEDYHINSITLSNIDIKCINDGKFRSKNKRELSEYKDKIKQLNLIDMDNPVIE